MEVKKDPARLARKTRTKGDEQNLGSMQKLDWSNEKHKKLKSLVRFLSFSKHSKAHCASVLAPLSAEC